jgi:hypothetical protein
MNQRGKKAPLRYSRGSGRHTEALVAEMVR